MDFINALKDEFNMTHTENGALTYKSTLSGILDLFGLGAAYRTRSDEDCCKLFYKAYAEDPTLALKCLFYLRDVRGGQGERRFFRTVLHDLAISDPEAVRRNLKLIPIYGRYDDWYCLIDTSLWKDVCAIIKEQLTLDMNSKTPSLLAKWLKSENTSSQTSRMLATKTRNALGISAREYRKMLSKLRAKINILETLMSQKRWSEILFDKIPSRAGFIYRNAFARNDYLKERYKDFMTNKETKVNAGTLYPYEVVHQANKVYRTDSTGRATLNKYWDNLKDYINNAKLNAIAVVDTSGSMYGIPMEVAVSLGMICAERCSGPYHNKFITFSGCPRLQEITGNDIWNKIHNLESTDWGWNTNIKAVFDLMLNTAKKNYLTQREIPDSIIIISDQEFDQAISNYNNKQTLFENIAEEWKKANLNIPSLIFWNVNARHDNIPMRVENGITFVSGFSTVLFDAIIKNKNSWDLVLEKLLSDRYKDIK